MKWPKATLGECATLVNGRAYKQEELLESGTPVLRIQNLNGGDKWYYSDLSLPQDKYCDKGDLLFAWSASFGPYLWNGPKAIYHYHIWKVLPGRLLDKGFLYYLLGFLTDRVKSESHGASMLHMTKARMEALEIPLPPLEEQRRIAAILDKAAMVREQATQSLAATSRALYDSIFSRDILATHHRMARIGDIAEQLPSGYGSDPGRLPLAAPVAKVSNVTAGGRFHREFENRTFTRSELERLLVGEHDLLVVKSSGSKANIISGKTAICGKNEAGVLVASNFLMRLCIDQSAADPRFVWHILNSKISKDFVRKVAGTTTYPNLKWSTYVDHPVPLPSLSEQRLIRERLDCINALSNDKGARLAEEAGNLIAVLQQQLIGK